MIAQLIREERVVNFFACYDFQDDPKAMILLGKNQKEFSRFLKNKADTTTLRIECGLEETSEID